MNKYQTLLNTLDQIRREAPPEFKKYYPLENDTHGLDRARSKALIHLFLKVEFGLLEFVEREAFVTEGTQDGGIDAFYIDDELRQLFFIQSKFRTNAKNFTDKEIALSELLSMDVDRIVDGEKADEKGILYNSKIQNMIGKIKSIPDIGRWKIQIIIIANLSDSITETQIKKLTGGFVARIYNHERIYQDLLFHSIQGTFYNPKELILALNLSNTSTSSSRIKYKVKTRVFECEIQVLFVPTLEIAKALYKYRNSILKYNLRSFLELANNNVNKDIAKSVRDLDCNEFALYNNGITMLSIDTVYSEKTFEKYAGQLLITQPQIINGGQTAYTLSRLYEDCLNNKENLGIFEGKEVLLKVIKLPTPTIDEPSIRELIESISKATNFQTAIDEADRRANDFIQIQLQENIYKDYGYFYERKRGEFADGVRYRYILRSQIIDRDTFIRLCKSCDIEPAEAKRSTKKYFESQNFSKTLNDPSRYKEYFYAYQCWEVLSATERGLSKEKNNKFGITNYGNALRYGKYAVITACMFNYEEDKGLDNVGNVVNETLSKWLDFESKVILLPTNIDYFRKYVDEETGIEKIDINFDNYYKGRTLKQDLIYYFKGKKKV